MTTLRAYPEIRHAQIAPSDFTPDKAFFRRRAVARQEKTTKYGVKYASNMRANYFGIGSKYIENQKDISDSYEHHGIRLDVYLRDEAGTVYAIEMQTIRRFALERRARFYQGSIDRNELLKGHSYSKLSESYVIFICDFDYFGTGLAVNERISYIKDTDVVYEDGSHVLFLNSRYEKVNAGPAIAEYLDYIRTNDGSRTYTTELLRKTVDKVQEVRSDDKMEVSYMMWELKCQDALHGVL